jgi:hypothetical protein
MSTWREKGEGVRGQRGSRKARAREREEGASSPFYSGSDIPGCFQVTVGQSLDKMLTPPYTHTHTHTHTHTLQ